MPKKPKKSLLYFLMIFLVPLVVAQECITPTDSMSVIGDIILCEGSYNLPNGIKINANDITLDCQNSTIEGNAKNTGIEINNQNNVTVKNCTLKNYKWGILLQSSDNNVLKHNTISNNYKGFVLDKADNNILTNNIVKEHIQLSFDLLSSKGNKILNNSIYDKGITDNDLAHNTYCNGGINNFYNTEALPCCNVICSSNYDCNDNNELTEDKCVNANTCDAECSYINVTEEIKEKIEVINEAKKGEGKEIIENKVSDELFKKLKIRRLDYENANKKLVLEKTKEIKDDKTIYEIKITAKEDIKELVLYEEFAKGIVERADMISSNKDFIVIEGDPILKIKIGEIKEDSTAVITFTINKKITSEENPESILTIEKRTPLITFFYYLFYLLLVAILYLRRNIHTKYKMLKEYIRKNIEKYSLASIKKKLIDARWSIADIEEAMHELKEEIMLKRLKKYIVELFIFVYAVVFEVFDISFKVLISENYAVIFFGILNTALLAYGIVILIKSIRLKTVSI